MGNVEKNTVYAMEKDKYTLHEMVNVCIRLWIIAWAIANCP